MTKISCVNRWLVVKPLNPETKTEGGLIIPDVAVERNDRAEIIEIAPAWMNGDGEVFPTLMAKGEEVFYNKDRGVAIVEKDVLAYYDIQKEEELIYLMYDDLYFVTKENKEGKLKRAAFEKQHGL